MRFTCDHVSVRLLLALLAAGCTGEISPSDDSRNSCLDCPAGPGAGPEKPGVNPNAPIDPMTGKPAIEGLAWSTRLPRLSHDQWENSVRDLLRLPQRPGLSATFSTDPSDARFDNYGARIVSSNLWADYQRAAETIAADVAKDAQKLARIRPAGADARTFVTQLGRRAFRRPLTSREVEALVALFQQGPTLIGGDAFASGAELVISSLLQSVHFLYRVEHSTKVTDGKIWLDSYEIASRLSYALWNTMPSDELLDAAGAGALASAGGVENWTRKMLDDPRAEQTLVDFHSQLLNVAEYGTIAKNTTLFPSFSPALQPIIQDEARAFVREVTVVEDKGIEALLTSPYTFVNDKTAGFYGVKGSFGPELKKVQLDPAQRAGFLTQIGFLSKYGSQTQSNPILRGVHVSLDFLCSDLPAPPPDIPPVPALKENQTNRERFAELTKNSPCNACHENLINPLGFAFENYDTVGAWRDMDNGRPVDASSMYQLDGETVRFKNGVELARLLAKSETVHRCYSDRWLEYALGRPVATAESGAVEIVSQVSAQSSAKLPDMLSRITGLQTFRARTDLENAP